jgi:hypothetical protein
MDHIGIDVHTKESQICILGEGGGPCAKCAHTTTPAYFADVLGDRPRARILEVSSRRKPPPCYSGSVPPAGPFGARLTHSLFALDAWDVRPMDGRLAVPQSRQWEATP